MKIYRCEDTLEGIFTAIYNIYEDNRQDNDVMIRVDDETFLFAEDIRVTTDCEKSTKVIRTLRRRFGEENYQWICFALASEDAEKAQAVYGTVAEGLRLNSQSGHLFDNLANQQVHKAFELARAASHETMHLQGFLRFQEVKGGILYASIAPKNNILTFLMPHFSDRFPIENFMIYDENRGMIGIHAAGSEWYLMDIADSPEAAENFRLSEGEMRYRELFKYFCKKIAIEARENPELQRNMLPLRFRGYMTEFR